jgi:hypothetical protein
MFQEAPQRPARYRKFERETPGWFRDAKLMPARGASVPIQVTFDLRSA